MPATHRPRETRDRFVDAFGSRPVTYADALAAGFTRSRLRAAVERGLLRRSRRGILVAIDPTAAGDTTPTGGTGLREHLDEVRAALRAVSPRALASHDSAAIAWGISRPSPLPPSSVTLAVPGAVDFTGPGLRVRGSGIPASQRDVASGIPVTGVARTAVDLARGHRLPTALIPLDSAARLLVARATGAHGNDLRRAVRDGHARATAVDALRTALDDCYGWPGSVAVRNALEHVDPAAESPVESRSRGWFLVAGLGDLGPGTPVTCAGTTYWADFCDPVLRVIGEADGWGKYGETAESMRETWVLERDRQHELERQGWAFVRWYGSESRTVVVSRMASALGHSALRRHR